MATDNSIETFCVVAISKIKVGNRHRKDLGDIGSLAESIERIGLLHPIVILADNTLVAGERRLEAFKSLGRNEIPANVAASLSDAIRFIEAQRDENTCRKDFSPSEAVASADELIEEERRRAKERQKDANKENGRKGGLSKSKGGNSPIAKPKRDESKRAASAAAKAVGMDRRTLDKAREVVEAAKAEPEKFGRLAEKMDATGKVSGVHRQLKVAKLAEEIRAEAPKLPAGKFHVIVADPPWHYEKRAEDPAHRGALPYPSMTLDQIKLMPVSDRAHRDSILWLWTTNAFMVQAHEVAREWGFEVKTILTWAKDRIGTGDWLRGQTEHCLMAVKGDPVVELAGQSTLLHGPMREHSRKPDEFYAMVDGLCPGRKCELFSRQEREGWTAFGAEVGAFES